jgi:exopolyphosphatase/guanosine-5'-triphosphate,3'-diphosphate pyrophosphatase
MIRKAVIDLGTNTFNLLIADVGNGHFKKVLSTKQGVALGMGGILQNRISEDAFERGMEALEEFKKLCDTHGVQEIKAIGTSALRDAMNANVFKKCALERFGMVIEIVDGATEAQLIYAGVKLTYDFAQPAMIMDIGGGSTEFIFAGKSGIQSLVSLNIGLSRLYQEVPTKDPLTKEDIDHIEQWLTQKTEGYFEGKQSVILVGASGTFETFYELIYDAEFDIRGFETIRLTVEDLLVCLNNLIQSTAEERNLNPRIIPIRKKLAPVAAVKTKWVLEKLGVKELVISPFSLKEGALLTF